MTLAGRRNDDDRRKGQAATSHGFDNANRLDTDHAKWNFDRAICLRRGRSADLDNAPERGSGELHMTRASQLAGINYTLGQNGSRELDL